MGYGAASLYAETEIYGPVTQADGSVDVGTSATRIVGSNPDRVFLLLVNNSTSDLYVRPGSNPTTTLGIFLAASGGSVEVDVRDDGVLPASEWWGISASGTGTLYYAEMKRYAESSPAKSTA